MVDKNNNKEFLSKFLSNKVAVLAEALECFSFCLPVIILSQFLTVNMLPILELYYTIILKLLGSSGNALMVIT